MFIPELMTKIDAVAKKSNISLGGESIKGALYDSTSEKNVMQPLYEHKLNIIKECRSSWASVPEMFSKAKNISLIARFLHLIYEKSVFVYPVVSGFYYPF